jgi:uncharacterized protein YecE (DUF72 family)
MPERGVRGQRRCLASRLEVMTARARIGTSGFSYPSWRGRFFPKGLPHGRELAYLAERLPTIEVNGTFYSLTRPSTCARWRAEVPADFTFAIKGSRYITHMRKLANFRAPLANFLASGILRLGAQLGPILWQLPPQLVFSPERAAAVFTPFFAALPRDVAAAERWARRHDARTSGRAALTAPDGRHHRLRHALEIRHESWLTDPALRLLEAEGIALVVADTAGKHPFSLTHAAAFADFVYVRLHGSQQLYASRYSDAELATWADHIRGWTRAGRDVYVYFDNDAHAHAPSDALRLQDAVALRIARPVDRRRHRPAAQADRLVR